jgi:hypothetical protein
MSGMGKASSGKSVSSAENSAAYQGLPLYSPISDQSGMVTTPWFRYFQSVWRKCFEGSELDETIYSTNQTANNAANTANSASESVAAETARATAAEGNLQTEVNKINSVLNPLYNTVVSLSSEVDTIQGQIDGVSFGAPAGTAGAITGYLNITVSGVAHKLPLYSP